jgi:putative ABC transport system substrate-binding protein
MRRREFIAILGGVAGWPIAVHGQQRKKIPRVGFLGLTTPAAHARFLEAFRRGLRDLGYIDGESIWVEYRWAEGQYDRLPQLATDLIREKVDLVVTYGSEGALAAKRSITTVPVVAVAVGDFVGAGVVTNLPKPEANVTGLSLLATEVTEKRMSLLRDTLPQLGKVAVLWNPGNASVALKFKSAEAAARALGIQVLDLKYNSLAELTRAISAAARHRQLCLHVSLGCLWLVSSERLPKLAGCGATGRTCATFIVVPLRLSINFLRERRPVIYPSSNPRNSNLLSIGRPLVLLVLSYLLRSSPAPTR